jgi:hypothetical protein
MKGSGQSNNNIFALVCVCFAVQEFEIGALCLSALYLLSHTSKQ